MYSIYESDYLVGTSGNDILDGFGNTAYYGSQQDTLTGGAGADIFVLGNAYDGVYYLDDYYYPDDSYAIITDYDYWGQGDIIQLGGGIQDYYSFVDVFGGSKIFYDGDLIAIVEGASTSDLRFDYV